MATGHNGLTYADAGVDIDAGNALVDRIKPAAKATGRSGVMGGLGGFGALFDLKAAGYADPILVAATDGGVAFAAPWPTDDPGLSRAQNRELQTLLLARGHDIGAADGLIGARTREAIKAEQQRLGMKADGRAGQKLLAALRG